MIITSILLSIATTMIPAVPAQSGAPRMIVHSGDLNLMSERGAAALRRRVDQARSAMAGDPQNVTGLILPDSALHAAQVAARRQADTAINAARANAKVSETLRTLEGVASPVIVQTRSQPDHRCGREGSA